MSSVRPRSVLIAGIIAILFGLWTGCGGCAGALGALGNDRDVPDSPFLSSRQLSAVQDFVEAAASLEPISAALAALAALVSVLLLVAGVFLLGRLSYHALVGRVAFGAAMAVDALAMVWSLIWYVLLYGPMSAYIEGMMKATPNPPPNMDEVLGTATVLAVVISAALNVGYYLAKLAALGWGLWVTTRSDVQTDADSPPPRPAPTHEPGLDWADEPPE